MPWISPILLLVLPFILVYSAASIYRSIYPIEKIQEAMRIAGEYRVLKQEARYKKTKRIIKRLNMLEADYRRAKSLILRSTGVKLLLTITGYMAGSILFLVIAPLLPAPYYIPLITVEYMGEYYVASFVLFFLSYISFYLILRDNFI